MNTPLIISLVVLGLLVLWLLVSASNRKARKEEARQKMLGNVATARAFWKKAEMRGGLLPVETTLILKDGEQAYFSEKVELMEPRAVRTGRGNRVGVRVTRGVWVSTGTSTYESNDVWKRLDEGTLTITNRRIVFDGQMGARNLELAKLVSVSPRATASRSPWRTASGPRASPARTR